MQNLVLSKLQPQKSILDELDLLREISLLCLGDWLEGSEWIELLSAAEWTPGAAEGILSAGHVKRKRYAHQVNAAALHILLHQT